MNSSPPTPQDLRASLQAALAWWDDMGVDVPEIAPPSPARQTPQRKASPSAPRTQSPKPRAAAQTAATPAPDDIDRTGLAQALAKAAPTLEALKEAIAGFDAGLLSDYAQNMVFARGNPAAKIMVIGEAPGAQEDEHGLPFIGEAGQLLDKMLAAIGLGADDSYITNICNWRPPQNRAPTPAEMEFCKPLIMRHIALAAPEMIMIVGGVSLQALTGQSGIMKARGRWLDLDVEGRAIPAMPIYHPAFLLRRPELKRDAWRDLLAIKARLSGEPAA